MKKKKLLLIGPLPPPVGGATVSFEQLAVELSKDHTGIESTVIDLKGGRPGLLRKLRTFAREAARILAHSPASDVISFHASETGFFLGGAFLYLWARICRKPLVLRAFGGGALKRYENSSVLIKAFFNRTVGRADLILFETKQLTEAFKELWCGEVRWFPNSRPLSKKEGSSEKAKKFMFLGHIRKDKGVAQLFEAAGAIPEEVTIELYGPLAYDLRREEINALEQRYRKARYMGPLAPEDVSRVMAEHDALVLPSGYPGEGHPGVVLEAYSAGLPVIATRWGGIPEIVDDATGILIERANPEEIARAISKLNEDSALYKRLQIGASGRAALFSSKHWAGKFRAWCLELAGANHG